MSVHLEDKRVRIVAFDWLDEQVRHYGDVLPHGLLVQGFELEGQRVPLVSRQGIFKPKVLREIPISITTSPSGGPYDDRMSPDGEPGGDPIVSNGLALCKLHHAAFDNFFLGIRPDYVIEIRPDVLDEEDGPMLLHGLQGLNGKRIFAPRSPRFRPSPERLQIRYQQFLEMR